MRDRLIELLDKANETILGFFMEGDTTVLADYLLAEGVIVPLCKAGDVVFQTDGIRIYPLIVERVIYDTNSISFDERAIGRMVFLTREEAEKALERSEGK